MRINLQYALTMALPAPCTCHNAYGTSIRNVDDTAQNADGTAPDGR